MAIMVTFQEKPPMLPVWFEKATLLTVDPVMAASWSTQSLATNSPAPDLPGVPSECLGTRRYETTSRDQRGKIEMFISSTGAYTAAKSPIANHHGHINAQL